MDKIKQLITIKLGVLALVVSVAGVGTASAVLTLDATTVSSDGNAVLTTSLTAGTIGIGLATGTGAITLGSSSGAQTVNIGTGTGASTINIATDDTVAGTINIGSALDGVVILGGGSTSKVEFAVSRPTGATGSFQPLAGDLTYAGGAGGTSTYHAGVMGNFLGASLTNTYTAMHAGVIGKYSVTGGDTSAGPQAGVVGELETDFGDAAIMAVLSGNSATATPNAAYGVQYLMTVVGPKFDYGIDLSHAQTVGLGAETIVSYGTADIRLQNGETISNGTDGAIDLASARLILDGPGPTFTGSLSRQTVAADATFSSYIGSSYGAAVMGNALGTLGAGASTSDIAGVIGKFNISDVGGNTGPKAAVVAEVGEEATGTKADAAVLAVLGGDPVTAITPGAAYGVRYLSSTGASKFTYGLDLFSAAVAPYNAVTYGTADIRLQNGETISNGTDGFISLGGKAIVAGAALGSHLRSTQTTAPDGTTGTCTDDSVNAGATDMKGELTATCNNQTAIVLFNVAYATAPACTVTPKNAAAWANAATAGMSYVTSTTALTITQTANVGAEVWTYICIE
ncbi:MAG: hypothetical protein HYW37_00065 [Candidatus Colwellbacteria bacterium]|nr:hypothetical protein [Candidatus Colwellbacteria bacterium]